MSFIACNDSDDLLPGYSEYVIATPLTTDLITFKEEAVEVTKPVDIIQSGKIYAYKNYIFVNDVGRGVHVLDNTNPESPQKTIFIKLEGNQDISIKNDRLYADSYGDLIVIDIADMNNIGNVKRLENAIYQEFWCTVGFDVEWSSINVFDISDLDSPEVLDEVYTSGGIETIFNQGNLLFLGGTRGMYIYDISEPATPTFVSDFEHGTACDPVVVDGNYAYVTLRGGNFCGATESGLFIVDISKTQN